MQGLRTFSDKSLVGALRDGGVWLCLTLLGEVVCVSFFLRRREMLISVN